MATQETDADYLPGRSASETERLQKQGDLLGPSLRSLFQNAGLAAGMRVLDVGSGAGDVALLAGALVGPTGRVVGIDSNPMILETARRRAHDRGMAHLSFVAGDIRGATLDGPFDAVVGRNVLLYNADPATILGVAASYVISSGIIAFHELDFRISSAIAAMDGFPAAHGQLMQWFTESYRRSGAHIGMAFELPAAFAAAGLPLPQMQLDGICGPEPTGQGTSTCATRWRW